MLAIMAWHVMVLNMADIGVQWEVPKKVFFGPNYGKNTMKMAKFLFWT